MGRRRSEIQIAVQLLQAIRDQERQSNGTPRKTRIQARTYLSWNGMNRYLERLRQKELVAREYLALTERGQEFLRAYQKGVQDFLERYGF